MNRFFNPPEIAKMLNISRQAVHYRIRVRKIKPYMVIGGTNLYDAAAVALIKQKRPRGRKSLSTAATDPKNPDLSKPRPSS